MMLVVDITAEQHETILSLLERHLPGTTVWAYGSRVKRKSRPTSDLDLVVFASPDQSHRVGDLREALEESDLPFRVDLFVWDEVPESFRERIKAEHVALVKKKQRDIGADWPQALLGDCIEVNTSTYSPKEDWSFINYLDTSNITENRISKIQHLIVGKDKIPSRARRKVQLGEIVYSTVRPNQKHFGLLRYLPKNFLVSTGFSVIRGKENIACTDFIYWFLAQKHIVELLHTIAEHSTTAYPSIRPLDIERLEIKIPSLSEQRDIADVLSAIDDKIELNQRMNETLKAMNHALFRSWFVDFDPVHAKIEGHISYLPESLWSLFPDQLFDSEIGQIPADWGLSVIGEEVNTVGGSTPSTKNPTYWNKGKYFWATPKDLSRISSPVLQDTERKITDAGIKKISSRLLPVGTVLLSSRAPIGYLAISEISTAINQGFIAMICKKRLSNIYVLFWCYENLEHIKNISGGSTFSEINKRIFRTIPVVVPSEKVLTAYENIARPLYNRIAVNMKKIIWLTHTRDFLLPKLISGEIHLRDAERIVETQHDI